MEKYSFLTSIYKKTALDELEFCIDSMINQTYKPDQIVIVVDGPIGDVLNEYINKLSINKQLYTIVKLENNSGLGIALREGMNYCRNELIARIDTDDYSVLDRCEKQVKYMESHPEIAVLGSNMPEFMGNISNIVAHRNVPETHIEICKYLKKRCPINHITVMLRKTEVERSGGYQDWHFDEDSFLWVRMYLAGCKFYNMQEDLAYARVGIEMYRRRGGYNYYKSERNLFKYMYKHKIINWFEYQNAKFVRFVVQVLMTNGVREWFFKNFARN